MTIKQYAYFDRPYEKLVLNGAEALSDTELLAILIKTGVKNKTALDISRELITKEGNIGLSFLTQYSIEELMKTVGIGRVKAIEIKALCEIAKRMNFDFPIPDERITTPEQLSRVFMKDMCEQKQEVVETAIFDSKNRVVKVIVNAIGTGNSCSTQIKDILSDPIKMGCHKIAIAHNHPSGDVTPSDEDVEFTKKLLNACKILDVQFLDHIIIRS